MSILELGGVVANALAQCHLDFFALLTIGMKTLQNQIPQNRFQSAANAVSKPKEHVPTFQFTDHRSETVAQRKMHATIQQRANSNPAATIQLSIQNWGARNAPSIQRKKLPTTVEVMQLHSEEGTFAAKPEIRAGNESVVQFGKPKPKKKPTKKPKKKMPEQVKKPRSMTVRNKKDSYSSGVIDETTRATGVKSGPRAEAQKVSKFLGGHWVGGHMINDQLGGSGDYSNIVPITSSMNGLHKTIENKANNLLSAQNGTEIEYQMEILKRGDVEYDVSTVKNLPLEFQQTLHVYPNVGANYTITGLILEEDRPGEGTVL